MQNQSLFEKLIKEYELIHINYGDSIELIGTCLFNKIEVRILFNVI